MRRGVLGCHAVLIDGTGAPARPGTSIVVEGERIVAVLPDAQADTRGARVVDLQGRHVIPGLIDTHVHLATPPDADAARKTLRRQLYSGVTAVRSMADDLLRQGIQGISDVITQRGLTVVGATGVLQRRTPQRQRADAEQAPPQQPAVAPVMMIGTPVRMCVRRGSRSQP